MASHLADLSAVLDSDGSLPLHDDVKLLARLALRDDLLALVALDLAQHVLQPLQLRYVEELEHLDPPQGLGELLRARPHYDVTEGGAVQPPQLATFGAHDRGGAWLRVEQR